MYVAFVDACESEEIIFDNYLNNTNSNKTHSTPNVPQSSVSGNIQHNQDMYPPADNYSIQPKVISFPESDVMNPPHNTSSKLANYNMPPTYNTAQYQTNTGLNTNTLKNQSNQYQNNAVYKQQQPYTPNQNTIQAQMYQQQTNQQAFSNAHKTNYMNNSSYGNQMPVSQTIGKIADYDPVTDGPRNSPYTSRQSSTLIYSSDKGAGIVIMYILVVHTQYFMHKLCCAFSVYLLLTSFVYSLFM